MIEQAATTSVLKSLFTIGHSNHSLEDFIALLRRHNISAIADVRSSPFSRFSPQFNRDVLESILPKHSIGYLFLGSELGARRTETECYVNNVARYELIARTPLFQRGLERVRDGLKTRRLALMCAEKDPLTCHRTILVCRHLRAPDVTIHHILADGSVEDSAGAESRLLQLLGLPDGDLFRKREQIIENAYDAQSEKIAYVADGRAGDESEL